jgi:hypothetical protein
MTISGVAYHTGHSKAIDPDPIAAETLQRRSMMTNQRLQAAVRQYLAWDGDAEAAPILIAAARYLAAHAPTPRAHHQTAQVARRLMRGGAVHEDASDTEP